MTLIKNIMIMIVRIVMVVKYQRWNHFTDEFITL